MNRAQKSRGRLAVMWSVIVTCAVLFTAAPPERSQAAVASGWDPGSIISDRVFYDSGSMSAAQVTAFLRDKGSACVAGERPCLKNYTETTRNWAPEPGLCAGYTGRPGESAGDIIARVAASCGISPKVLLTVLQKETSLVTKSRPTAQNYNTAMGFGCPDTAPCNTEYYGFFNQVYRAARQFKVYAANPTRYGYQAGRSNYIQYNPNPACGGSNVTIRNQATASLYIYTPYQPNKAALANLYGTGDSCSAYGNRNFWRTYTDWFGDSRQGGYFITSTSTSTVYLVTGTVKYAVPDWGTYLAYAPLGPIAWVSDAQLNGYPTVGSLGRFVRNRGTGEVFFADNGSRNHVPTCAMILDYGSPCGGVVDLDAAQIGLLRSGPQLATVATLSDGRTFAVLGGQRREVFDDASRAAAQIPATRTQLSASALDYLPRGMPIIRDGSVATGRSGGAALWAGGRSASIPPSTVNVPGLATLPHGTLDTASIAALPSAGGAPGVFSREGQGVAILTGTGLVSLDATAAGGPVKASSLPGALFDRFPRVQNAGPLAMTASSTSKVYVLVSGYKRWALTWNDLVNRFGGRAPAITWVGPETLNALPTGPDLLPAGMLVQGQGRPEVYLVDAGNRIIWIDSPDVLNAFGTWSIARVPVAALTGYQVDPDPLLPLISCPDARAGVGGQRRPINRAQAGPLPATALGAASCAKLTASGPTLTGPLFVTSRATTAVYVVIGGVKRPIANWNALLRLRGSSGAPIFWLTDSVLQRMPTGAQIS